MYTSVGAMAVRIGTEENEDGCKCRAAAAVNEGHCKKVAEVPRDHSNCANRLENRVTKETQETTSEDGKQSHAHKNEEAWSGGDRGDTCWWKSNDEKDSDEDSQEAEVERGGRGTTMETERQKERKENRR